MKIAADLTTTATGDGRRMTSFVVTGGIAAVVNLVSRWLLSHVIVYEAAVTIAYLIGMVTAFVLARTMVFDSSGNGWINDFGRFAIVNAGSFLIVLGVSAGLARLVFPAVDWHWHADDIAHLIGVASPLFASYYAHKHFSFRRNDG